MLVAGVALLAAVIVQRLSSAPGGARAPFAASLDEPAGTRIVGVAAAQDRIAVTLQGGGPDRIVLLDPRTGARTGTVALRP